MRKLRYPEAEELSKSHNLSTESRISTIMLYWLSEKKREHELEVPENLEIKRKLRHIKL